MSTETLSLNDVADATVVEEVLSLEDFASDPGGAWPKGWYAAEIIEGYSTPKGKVFTTDDAPSKNGDSRNFRLCFKVTGPIGDERTMQENFNYRETDFSAGRLAQVKQARLDNAGARGAWGDKDTQRSSLAVATIGQIEKAFGTTIRTGEGRVIPGKLVGVKVDIRLSIDEDGYNVVTGFDKPGTRSSVKKKA